MVLLSRKHRVLLQRNSKNSHNKTDFSVRAVSPPHNMRKTLSHQVLVVKIIMEVTYTGAQANVGLVLHLRYQMIGTTLNRIL